MTQATATLRRTLNAIFGRPETQRWSYIEESGLVDVAKWTPADDVEMVRRWYTGLRGDDRKTLPQSVETMLMGWNKCLDRARLWQKAHKPATPLPPGQTIRWGV